MRQSRCLSKAAARAYKPHKSPSGMPGGVGIAVPVETQRVGPIEVGVMMRGLKHRSGRSLPAAFATLAVSAFAAVAAAAQDTASAVAQAPAAAAVSLAKIAPTPGVGQPSGGWRLQDTVTPIGHEAHRMVDNVLDPMMVVISLAVMALLAYVMIRFRAGRNPVPSRTSHNTMIEVVWTLIPVLILVWIAVPSFRLLANQYDPPKADLTIKAIGHQWYWEYEYPDQGGFSFDSIALTADEAKKANLPYLLEVDNRVVVPVGVTVKVLTTAADVIHAWSVPSFYLQMDAVPGRINETWFKAEREGVYYGQCNQLCGTRHGFMPITVEVVSRERFDAWVAAKQKENGITPKSAAAPVAAPATADAAVATPATATAVAGPAAPAASEVKPTPAAPAATPTVN
jgi:cytochrome c oxidase subunit II